MKSFFIMLLLLCVTFASTYRIDLEKGYNLVSIPYPSVYLVENNNCIVNRIWVYYGGKYITSNFSTDIGNPLGINYNSFFVYAKEQCSIELGTDMNVSQLLSKDNLYDIWQRGGGGLNFKKGWNFLAGFYASPEVDEISGDCTITSGPYRYDAVKREWSREDTLKPGMGYIVKVSNDCKFGKTELTLPTIPQFPN